MNYWLVKTEPDVFGWDKQVEHGVEPWTGVRSFQARNNLRAMRMGDLAFFYHSNEGLEIVGVVEVVREAYPDPTADKVVDGPKKGGAGKGGPEKGGPGKGAAEKGWSCVDMRAVGPMKRPVTLVEIKADPALEGMALIRASRLSVSPVSAQHWAHICKLGGFKAPKR